MKNFTSEDVKRDVGYARIYADRADLLDCPLNWQKLGLQQTASGYGRKLTMREKISYNGRMYRLYCTICSNIGSVWFTCKGETIYVS